MKRRRAQGATVLLALAIGPAALAHGPLDASIAQTTRELAERPVDADLWARRAELHRVHGDLAAAEEDLARAAAIAPGLLELDLYRGRLALDAGRFELAEQAFARFLTRSPGSVAAHAQRAEALLRLGRLREAADAYASALRIRPGAGLYLAHARTLTLAGDADGALVTLDQAVSTLGPVYSLERYAIDLELAAQRYDAALERLDRLHAGAARRDGWLVERAEILARAGRSREARVSYAEARVALEELPPSRRGAVATHALEVRLREGLARLPAAGE
jgi:tetratricopeptide (TPR) repeat protein